MGTMIKNLFFIDSRVADYQTLVAGLGADSAWVLLDADQDGVLQMQSALANYSHLDSIQIVSHGSAGTLYLGSTRLDSANADDYQSQLQTIGSSLTETGDLLLYGCNVGAGATGAQFIASLAALTGADVAASDDATGQQGDWILESATGAIETAGLAGSAYTGTLNANDHATEGNDILIGEGLMDTIHGLGGDDFIDGEAGPDLLYGDAGNDTIDGNFGNDTLYGGLGNDVLRDHQGTNYLDGGEGADTLTSQALTGSYTLVGGLGNDTLTGTGEVLSLSGNEDNDRLSVSGSLGSTYVQHGQATLSGGLGSDNLRAEFMANALLRGDEGSDTLTVGYSKNATLEGGAGNDTLSGSVFNGYHVNFGETAGAVYRLDGGADDDTLSVTSDANLSSWGVTDLSLEGGTGNDILSVTIASMDYGPLAYAQLSGGDGNDQLTASGVMRSTLTGGAGNDTFVLTAVQYQSQQVGSRTFSGTTITARPMEITDFTAGAGGDLLDLRDLFRNGASGFDGSNPFGNGYLRLVQSEATPSDTLLQFDANGGGNGYVTLAVLKNVTATALVGANFNPGYPTDGSEMPGILINGTLNPDTLLGSAGGDTLLGSDGNDSIDGDAGSDRIDGGPGNDTIDGNFGNDTLYGGLGNDVLRDHQGTNYLDGGEGADTLISQALTGSYTLVGGLGNDTLTGTGEVLSLSGNEDNDRLSVSGSLGSTYVQHGQATLSGGLGSDNLRAEFMANALLRGDEGSDTLTVGYSKNATLEGGAGNDTLSGSVFNGYHVNFGETAGAVYRLDGGADDDTLSVTSDANLSSWGVTDLSLEGGTGNDILSVTAILANGGPLAYAQLSGGDGNDQLTASGVMRSTLTGGAGNDTFVLTAVQYQSQQVGSRNFNGTTVTARPMEITDFTAGRNGEKLDIRDLLQNGATNYAGTNPFKSGHLDVVQSGADTLLQFDANGGGDHFVTLAVLQDVKWTELVAKNFSPLFGTPNGDIMSGLKGGPKHDGIGGNDMMLGFELPNDDPETVSQWETLLSSAQLTSDDLELEGGEGADTMVGGLGHNIYHVDHEGDVVKQVAGAGSAVVVAAIDYTLGENLTGLVVAENATAGTKGQGNGLDNVMRANDNGNELSSDEGNDQVFGGKGKDKLYAGSGNDQVDAGEGDDEIVGGDGAGDDTYVGGAGSDLLRYTSATTRITVNLGTGTANGTDIGSDVLSEIENIIGGQAGDSIVGSSGANAIDGYTGADTISGGVGADTLQGGDGNDTLYGNQDNDQLLGDNGDDWMHGGQGDDALDGGAGNDTLAGGLGNDTLTGGDGLDTADYSTSTDQLTINLSTLTGQLASLTQARDLLSGIENLMGGAYGDALTGDNAANLLNGLAGNDTISGGVGADTLQGGDGNDTLYGNQDNDQLFGGNGDDWIHGGQGIDLLEGGAGNDTVAGGLGNDLLSGGSGNDVFLFNAAWGAGNVDTITDFQAGDQIALSASVFTAFAGRVVSFGANLSYDTGTGALAYDADGAGGQAAVIIAVVGTATHPALTQADFMLG
jgi:Ca2+-binding RTX toxin-like protein